MPTYHNPPEAKATLEFELGGTVFRVPPGANLHVPARLDYAIASRGLPLKKGTSPLGERAPEADERPYRAPRQILPPGVQLGERKRDEDEDDEDDGDTGGEDDRGPALGGDDGEGAEDPIAKTLEQLESNGVDTSLLAGKKARKRRGE